MLIWVLNIRKLNEISLTDDRSSAMAVYITMILFLTSALQDVHSTCKTPQFVEYGQEGAVKCKFEEDTVGLYWYELINSTYELQIKLDAAEGGNIVISGPGYLDHNFDILDDGSLMIFNVTNYQTRNFKAVHVNSDYLVTEKFVELVTSILSNQKFPSVSVCDGDDICFLDSNEFYNLACSYHQSRPAVEMAWYRQSHEGVELIAKNPSISMDGKWTFSSVLNLNVTKLINGPLVAFICRVSTPALNSITMESTVVVYSNERRWQSLVQANRTETFHLINASAEVFCSKAGTNQLLFWKELHGDYSEARVLYINGMEKYLSNFTSDWRISREGSIVVDRMDFASQGVYTCISTNERHYYSMENKVTVQVPPTPPFIVADGCPLENKHCAISLRAETTIFSISCTVKGVYPKLDLGMEGSYFSNDTKITTQVKRAKDGQTYDVMVLVLLHPQECGMVQNVTCFTNGPKQFRTVSDKTISIQTECVIEQKAEAVIIPMVVVMLIFIVLLYVYFRRKKQKQKIIRKEAEDSPNNELSPREDEEDPENTEQLKQPVDQPMEKSDDFSEVSEISENTHLLDGEADISSDDNIEVNLKEDEDPPSNVLSLRKDAEDPEITEQPKQPLDQPMEKSDDFSEVSEISDNTHLLDGEADISSDDNIQLYVLKDGKSISPFDDEVIKILQEEPFAVNHFKNMEIELRSLELFQDKKKWERVKRALKNVTAWYRNLEFIVVLYHVTFHLKKDTWDSLSPSEVEKFQHGVQELISSVEENSLNDIKNFRRRVELLVKEFEQINLNLRKDISDTQWRKYLRLLQEKWNLDSKEMVKSCLLNILSVPIMSTFARLIEVMFLADVINDKGTIRIVTASTEKTKEERIDERLAKIMKGVDVARIALSAGKTYAESEKQMEEQVDRRTEIEEKQLSTSLCLKDTGDLMERINLAIQKSNQNMNVT